MSSRETWIVQELSALLGVSSDDVDDTILVNLQTYDNPYDLEVFLKEFVSDEQLHKVASFVKMLFPPSDEVSFEENQAKTHGQEMNIKPQLDNKSISNSHNIAKKKSMEKGNFFSPISQSTKIELKENSSSSKQISEHCKTEMQRNKMHKADRRVCFCNAQDGHHHLVGNCLTCGKIVCSEEGDGPCLFCGNEIALAGVIGPVDVEEFNQSENDDDNDMLDDSNGDGLCVAHEAKEHKAPRKKLDRGIGQLKEAVKHKNRLLEFERTSAQRTRVFDDSTDWFSESTNQWLSQEEREKVQLKAKEIEEKKRDAKHSRYVTFDFTTGKVTENRIDIPDDTVSAVDEFLMKAREREIQRLEQSNQNIFSSSLSTSQISGQDPPDFHSVRSDVELPIGPAPGLSGDALDLYKMLRERIQLSTTTVTERRSVTASPWGSRIRKKSLEKQSVMKGSTIYENIPTSKQRWRNTRSDDLENSNLLMADDLGLGSVFELNEVDDQTTHTGNLVILEPEEPSHSSDSDDGGICLSLHQPWASMLVHGFKRIEGRVWSTDYRGRLWIHACSKKPDPIDIEGLKLMYADFYDTRGRLIEEQNERTGSCNPVPVRPPFPSEYPTSCLLGCLDLVNCLAQSDYTHYREQQVGGILGTEDNTSPFIFICQNPRQLLLPVKMKGGHKLWRLPFAKLPYFRRALRPVLWPLKTTQALDKQAKDEQKLFNLLPDTLTTREFRSLNDVIRSIGSLTPELWKNWRRTITVTPMQNEVFLVLRNFFSPLLQQAIVMAVREVGSINLWKATIPTANNSHRRDDISAMWSTSVSAEVSSALFSYYQLICEVTNEVLKEPEEIYDIQFPVSRANYCSAHFVPLQRHEDTTPQYVLSEKPNNSALGHPTILICIGHSILFHKALVKSAESTISTLPNLNVLLNGGDILVIQEESINRHAEVLDQCVVSTLENEVQHNPMPSNIAMKPGTLLLTLRR